MASFENDDELERAIALSLQEISPVASPEASHDEDMRLAIALSLEGVPKAADDNNGSGLLCTSFPQYATAPPIEERHTQQQVENSNATTSKPWSKGTTFALDRKAMEQERLARLGKRKRSASPERPSKQIATQLSSTTSTATGMQFPTGTIKRTWAYKHPRTDDITLEEILQVSTLNIAVLSSFQWEDRFIFHKADPKKVKHYWILGADGEEVRARILQELNECNIPNLKPHFPPMRRGFMHSKLMLLFHETHLRIVIPTANLMKVEWGETGQDPKTPGTWQPAVLENTVFLIDLPRLPGGEIAEALNTAFGGELVSFLKAQQVDSKVIEGLHKFDFSKTSRLGFVHSIPGTHSTEPQRSHTGLPGLARTIRHLNLANVERIELDYASSSLGALKEDFLRRIYLAASGLQNLSAKTPEDFHEHVRVYFPTRDTVLNSTGGVDCGGIITLNAKSYNMPSFARQCLRDHKSTRPGVLSHSKILLARGYKKDGKPFAWAYVGSANATESAWGAQNLLKFGKESSLKVNNWECGVVVPVPKQKLQGFADREIPSMDVFDGTVEVPFQFPGEKYEGKEPWFFFEHLPKDT